jgi:hypothetical protein
LFFLRTPSSQGERQLDIEDDSLLSHASTSRLSPEGMEHRPGNCELDEIPIEVPKSTTSSRRIPSRSSSTLWRLPFIIIRKLRTESIVTSDLQTPTSPSNENLSFVPEPNPEDDDPDPALFVLEKANGDVTAGTVEGLIERLISDSPGQLLSSILERPH